MLSALAICLTSLIPSVLTAEIPEFAEYRGHVVYVDFWASWCGPCRQSFPWMQRIQKMYASKGLVVVAVNLDRQHGDAERFLASFPHDFAVRFDAGGDLPSRLRLNAMPTSLLIDQAGEVSAIHAGFKPADEPQYEAEIEHLLNRNTPP